MQSPPRSDGLWRCLLVALLLYPAGDLAGQNAPTPLAEPRVDELLGDFVGEWSSEFYEPEKIPEPYRDGFMLRVVAELDGDAARIESGDKGAPPTMIGLALWDPGAGAVAMIEYNQDGGLYFRGHYVSLGADGVRRIYDVSFPDGTTRRYREDWRWNNADRTSFDWLTDEWVSGAYVSRGLAVKLNRKPGGGS